MAKKRNWEAIGEIILKIEELGMKYVEGAEHFNINVRTIYNYNRRIRKKLQESKIIDLRSNENSHSAPSGADQAELSVSPESAEMEADKKKKASGEILPAQLEELILCYRQENPDHGYKRIEDYLKKRYFVVVPRKKIRAVLKSHGLTSRFDSSFDRKSVDKADKGSRRFEAAYPRELYQMDVTYVYISKIPVLYLVLIIDDHSRFCVGCSLCHDQRSGTMIEVLHQAIQRCGKPQKLLTDQGSNFYTWSREQTLFQKYLDDMEIEHIVAAPHSPQTLGKVERLNQTIQKELLHKGKFNSYEQARRSIEDYFHTYNYERVHQGIGGQIPSERFWGIEGETTRIESELKSHFLDFSNGYLVFKNQEHTLSVVCSSKGLQVFLDGRLLSLQGGQSKENAQN
jgi:transposase InsO family protein